ncbi:MAG: BamA/TamA family outer membrane protein [Bacteroidales bacterium]|nr:BamA/TamA family outer membrane protein [Bacteroidales bacterium]
MRHIFSIILSMLLPLALMAQNSVDEVPQSIVVDYNNPQKYIIGGLRVEGTTYVNKDQIASLSGMLTGSEIQVPGENVSEIVRRVWMQRYFSDVGLYIDSLSANKDTAYFVMKITERPRVSEWKFSGLKKSEKDDIQEKLNLRRGRALSEYVQSSSVNIITKYLKEKGFLNTKVDVLTENDTLIKNAVKVTFAVDRGKKVKVKRINYSGVEGISKFKLDWSMKKTKDMTWYNLFSSKKFNEDEYPGDKEKLIETLNELGYRDAKIVKDSIYFMEDNRLGIDFQLEQGKRYYFRNITWTGNSVYPAEALSDVLKINKGDIYDVVTMNERLYGGGKDGDITINKLFSDNGYLFFSVTPVEVNIVGDSVDVEMRIVEGKQATFNNVIISGNNVTNENVIRRAVFTRPGYLYRQTDFERSLRELGTMTNFDAEKIVQQGTGWNLLPDPVSNTVDISYNVEEKANSQLELSGGWGSNMFVGSVGVNFSNFSTRNMFRKEAWRPVPLGDAQTLAIRFQTNGSYYTALTGSFVEPWLFGKKPTSLNISLYYTKQTNSVITSYYQILNDDEYFKVYGGAAGLGSRLKWPDNYFVLYHQLSLQTYELSNWSYNFLFSNGKSHNFNYTITLSRNSTDQQIYPRQGSDLSFSISLTPPYSLFRDPNTDYSKMADSEHYRWIEYNKWTFKGSSFIRIVGDLVLMTRAQFGYLGYYNKKWGYSPFEGFLVGGDGMSGYNTYGQEVIGLRGYENYSLTPTKGNAYAGNVYDKFTVELRYPIIMQPQSTIFVLAFLEGGNCWSDIKDFNPFQIKRSAGAGLRVMLPVVGLMGIDWGYGFDSTSDNKGQFHFVIGQQF